MIRCAVQTVNRSASATERAPPEVFVRLLVALANGAASAARVNRFCAPLTRTLSMERSHTRLCAVVMGCGIVSVTVRALLAMCAPERGESLGSAPRGLEADMVTG
eukprot:comp19481_c0_seq1/m.22706 comp19481_c0_seq1/g.22706  ORF comp19481_c0_seq1/g.22706 comp19481_c0_seq1/m.22706 type:complete len:105 (-) comp19481_c0_seq1:395-709(-)